MNALLYLYTRSVKNRVIVALKSPKFILKVIGLIFFIGLILVGAITGANFRGEMDPMLFKGVMFLVFLVPYWAGRYSGGGSFGMEDVNFVFTAPIRPRAVLLSGLVKHIGGMLLLSAAVLTLFIFTSALAGYIELGHILIAGAFGLVLMFVCKLLGMYLFIAYRKVFRWVGLFWMLVLAGVYIFYVNRADWDWMYGLYGLFESRIFDFTPLVGWAMAGAHSFMAGQLLWGLLFSGLLAAAGYYFFRIIYRSKPDFYEETLESTFVAEVPAPPQLDEIDLPIEVEIPDLPGAADFTTPKIGAAAFFHKHQLEAARTSRFGILGLGIFVWVIYGLLWGFYARGYDGGFAAFSMIFMYIGVPGGNILAVLAPMVFAIAIYPQFDRGFREFSSPYFYLIPDNPSRKLLWASMSRIINVCVAAVFVLGPAGVISRTAPLTILATMLAYITCSFMVLGVRAATIGLFASEAGRRVASTLVVLFFVLAGWIGLMTMFFLWSGEYGLIVGLLSFSVWCIAVGAVGFWNGVRGLHDLDVVG